MRFLVSGLHDDLNRVTSPPPYQPISDKPGESEAAAAVRWWENHRARNDSVLVDTFCGQLKSHVVCGTCGHVSTAYDPFYDLSLPIPKSKSGGGRGGGGSAYSSYSYGSSYGSSSSFSSRYGSLYGSSR